MCQGRLEVGLLFSLALDKSCPTFGQGGGGVTPMQHLLGELSGSYLEVRQVGADTVVARELTSEDPRDLMSWSVGLGTRLPDDWERPFCCFVKDSKTKS